MVTAVEDLLRLAWQANGDRRAGLRDALMTLAVADSGGENLALAERCRRVLVARQPDHWFASSDSLGHALSRPKVIASLAKLRTIFPPARVRHLLLRGDAGRGPYQGRPPALSEFLGELAPRTLRRDAASSKAHPTDSNSTPSNLPAPDGSVVVLYLSVLLAMAVVLSMVLEPAVFDSKAA
jgi:hypothetical protein